MMRKPILALAAAFIMAAVSAQAQDQTSAKGAQHKKARNTSSVGLGLITISDSVIGVQAKTFELRAGLTYNL